MKNPYEQIKQIRQRRRKFLKDIKDFYREDNRAINNRGLCVYKATKKSPGCAIGRWLDTKPDVIADVRNRRVAKHLPTWMTEMGIGFLRDCQELHDVKCNWQADGLSQWGKESYRGIKVKFKL